MSEPTDTPPTYAQATGSSTASKTSHSHLSVPQNQNDIPTAARRSMEDEQRPLPPGWLRQWDPKEHHQFFVDTNANPPRSIWHHPYDDDDYLKTLSAEERERIQESEHERKVLRRPASVASMEDDAGSSQRGGSGAAASSSGRKEKPSLGERLKNKVTGKTHEERVAERARQQEEERQYYEAHLKYRNALQQAQITGQPQFLAKDRDGKDVYVEPPQQGGYYGGGYGDVGYGARGGYGYGYNNPYPSGAYADPNARFIRPQAPYGRPYGGGYGGGYGFPIAGGLLGGLLLGGLLF